MDLFDDIKSQMKGKENNIDESQLPWIADQQPEDAEPNKQKSLSTKKIAKLGLICLIGVVAAIAIFNFINNNNSVSVDNSNSADTQETSKGEIQVHVAGEVNKPGVYKLEEGSRIMDAVNAAGGFTIKANQSSLNLAKVLEDGEQIKIDSIDESTSTEGSTGGSSNNGKVNINTADLSQLQTLSGVGPATAQKIIDYRNANGKFKTIEDLKKVSGIGDKTFEKFKDQICV